MGTTCDEGPLCITDLKHIYLYWQWLFGTPEKLLVRGFMLSLVPCDSPGHGGLNLCWFSSWLFYKSGRREYSFFYSAGPILPTELLCILLCRFWWVVVNLWVEGLDFCCLWSVSLVILRLTYSIHLGRSVASTPGPWVGVTLGSAARYAYPALDASPVC